jgi:methionine biosynthesis protein MetW
MNPRQFYDQRWRDKELGGAGPQQRDWLHRNLLDRVVDPLASPRREVALALIPPPPGRLLDIGCWKGEFIEAALAGQRCVEAMGTDLARDAVDNARERGLDARVHDLNEEPLPFAADHFDCVTLLGVLEHLFDPYAVFAEVHRVLRGGGHLIVAVPNAASVSNRVRLLLGRELVTSLDPGWDGGHLHYFTLHSLHRLGEKYGFEVDRITGTGAKRRVRERWPSLLFGELVLRMRKR